MESKCTNTHGEIVLAKKLNHVELSFEEDALSA